MKRRVKEFLKNLRPHDRFAKKVGYFMPDSVCVDVGAAHFPHIKWLPFLNSPKTKWIAVEPDVSSMGYLKFWDWPATLKFENIGLSESGGICTLYETNVKTGSSLLKPQIKESMALRKRGREHKYFPCLEKQIETETLDHILKKYQAQKNIFVKLDTQGTELSILNSAKSFFTSKAILGIDTECSLLAEPIMEGSSKLWHFFEFLEDHGFECLELRPHFAASVLKPNKKTVRTHLHEADVVFCLRRDQLVGLDLSSIIALFGFYVSNKLYEEAYYLTEQFPEVEKTLSNSFWEISSLQKELQRLI